MYSKKTIPFSILLSIQRIKQSKLMQLSKINFYRKIFIFFVESRQRGRFAGFSLYVSNTDDIHGSTLCYKNGPQLPPLNFTTTCPKYGRYVIFYNERLDGVAYPKEYEVQSIATELCEVIVKGKTLKKYFLIPEDMFFNFFIRQLSWYST